MVFLKKVSIGGKWAILAGKWQLVIILDLVPGFFLMKGGKREVHEYDIHGFSDKKYYFWQKGHNGPKHGVTS